MGFRVESEHQCPRAENRQNFSINVKLSSDADSGDTWTREVFVNMVKGPRDEGARITSISPSSPCPMAPDAPEALDFVSEWLSVEKVASASPAVHSPMRGYDTPSGMST